jgi:hypothetical protein
MTDTAQTRPVAPLDGSRIAVASHLTRKSG